MYPEELVYAHTSWFYSTLELYSPNTTPQPHLTDVSLLQATFKILVQFHAVLRTCHYHSILSTAIVSSSELGIFYSLQLDSSFKMVSSLMIIKLFPLGVFQINIEIKPLFNTSCAKAEATIPRSQRVAWLTIAPQCLSQ